MRVRSVWYMDFLLFIMFLIFVSVCLSFCVYSLLGVLASKVTALNDGIDFIGIYDSIDAGVVVSCVYRELLFLGEWMDASDGACPLFSHTFLSMSLCLKSCRCLIPAYPNLSDSLKVLLLLKLQLLIFYFK